MLFARDDEIACIFDLEIRCVLRGIESLDLGFDGRDQAPDARRIPCAKITPDE